MDLKADPGGHKTDSKGNELTMNARPVSILVQLGCAEVRLEYVSGQ